MEETKQLTVQVDEAIAKQKEATWAKLGRGIYIGELKLQAMSQEAISRVKLPTKFEEVKEAEEMLKALKKTKTFVAENRMELTRPMDGKIGDLRKYEVMFDQHVTELTNVIIKIKKEEEDRLAKIKRIEDEKKSVRESLVKQLASVEEASKTKILTQITKAYEWALTNNVKPESVKDYLDKCAAKLDVFSFTATPAAYKPNYITQADYDLIYNEVWVLNADAHLSNFQNDLKKRFENYEIEFKNKEAALASSVKESVQKQAEINEESQNKQIAATLESTATILTTPEVKALKKAYQLEMEENEVNAHKIMQAYYGNLNLCRPKMQVKNWFNFGVKNVITALEKVKNDDNNFSPAGIIFKEIDKL